MARRTVEIEEGMFLRLTELAMHSASASLKLKLARMVVQVVGPCEAEILGVRCQNYDRHPGGHSYVRSGVNLEWESNGKPRRVAVQAD